MKTRAVHHAAGGVGFLCAAFLASDICAAGLDRPAWQEGLTWNVAASQKSVGSPMQSPPPAVVQWHFRVAGRCVVDGVPAHCVLITTAAQDGPVLKLFCSTETLTVLRLEVEEVLPAGPTTTVHVFTRTDAGPTMVPCALVPLSLPQFDVAGRVQAEYVHSVNGLDGFARKVLQTVKTTPEGAVATLSSGSQRISQQWRAGLPWPLYQDEGKGAVRSWLIPSSVRLDAAAASATVPPVLDSARQFGARRGGRWWPGSAFARRPPWSGGSPGGADAGGERAVTGVTAERLAVPSSEILLPPPWSGYWWPMLEGYGSNLYVVGGPLDKYDLYVRNVTGSYPSPKARDWEYQNYRTTDPETTSWYGHCDGWSAAAVLEPEPNTPRTVGGVNFSVADRKGILTSWHTDGGYATIWGTIYADSGDDIDDIYPYEFITVLIQHVVNQGTAVIADLTQTDQMWNYPIYGYDLSQTATNQDGSGDFRCKIYYASDGVAADYVGTKTATKTLEFRCGVDAAGNFVPGPSSWLRGSASDHPDFLWFPAPLNLVNPKRNQGLRKEHVLAIAGPPAAPQHAARVVIRHTWIGDLTVRIGVSSPSSPQWSKVLWNRAGGSADDIVLDVDLTEAAAYLPPGPQSVWFLEVNDAELGDTGKIEDFTIKSGAVTRTSPDTPVAIVDRQTRYAYIGAAAATATAQVNIQHTYVGDLVVQLGVGNPDSPAWAKTVANRQGGGADQLLLDVDVSDAAAYLPPSPANRWFVKVQDLAIEDEGVIQSFAITHAGTQYASASFLPVEIRDQEISYALVGPVSIAKVDIAHPYRGDLVVRIGVGSPASPLWARTLSNRQGGAFDDVICEVDLSDAAAYLPPSPSFAWFLEVQDAAAGDVGTVRAFTVKHLGQLFPSDDVPLAVPDNGQPARAYVGDNLFTSFAHIDIQHTWRGDLVVKVGVGDPASPRWVKTVSDKQGGSADDLVADVDVSEAAAYMPPSPQNVWFLEVYDSAAGDQGKIRQFTVQHAGASYPSGDPPVGIVDLQKSYAYVGRPPPTSIAHIDIQHTWRGDLVVKVGVGNPASPLWVKTVSDKQGGSADDLVADVDVSEAAAYMPPSPQNVWFLEVYDSAAGDQGKIRQFTITHLGQAYASANPPVPIKDKQTCYAYIGPLPPTSIAHVVIRHPWRGDLVVKVGTGNPAAPDWVTTICNREGGSADDVIADVDISAAAAFMPPSAQHRWFLQAYDAEKRDTGYVQSFSITHLGTDYVSTSTPVNIPDLQTVYAYVP